MPASLRSSIGAVAVAVAVSGCLPVVLPAPSERDPVPYTATDLAFVRPGETTREQLVAAIGEPMLERRNGRIAIYGTVQKTGIQGVLFLFPAPVPLGGDAREVPHHLFVRYDDSGILEQFEVVRDEGCTADGLCIEGSTTRDAYAAGDWYLENQRMSPANAVVYDTGEAAVRARQPVAGAGECVVFLYQSEGPLFLQESGIRVSLDDGPVISLSPRVFARLVVAPGTHHVHTTGEQRDAADLALTCAGAAVYFVDAKLRLPSWSEQEFRARIVTVDAREGAEEVARRSLLLVD